jgi:N-acetylmuramoyl-L-alanine amidase
MIKNITLLIISIISLQNTIAQNHKLLTYRDLIKKDGLVYQIQSDEAITSIALTALPPNTKIKMTAEAESHDVIIDNHLPTPNTSYLWVLKKPTKTIEIESDTDLPNARAILLHVPPISHLATKPSATTAVLCDGIKPTIVPTTVWRAGLPAPRLAPESTITKHLIVHHAAGSNTDMNYTSVVRNIYIFHTQSNGWNDVGYNFLIAQDGTIFEGRDGQNQYENDNVLGAHFCSKNGGTMGVCLLGNYMTAVPTEASQKSLLNLLAWKLKKEKLNVNGFFQHPANNPVGNLGILAGHRDGCSTDCPGDNVYILLAKFRKQLSESCPELLPLGVGVVDKIKIRQNNRMVYVESQDSIERIVVYDIAGRLQKPNLISQTNNEVVYDFRELAKGEFFIRATTNQNEKVFKMIVQ